MRYRKLTASGDYSFGHGLADFYIDVPDAPAQACLTKLRLWLGEWFLNLSAGVPYETRVLGKYTGQTRDIAIQSVILGTEGVNGLLNYSSAFDSNTRAWSVNALADTIYGPATIQGPI